MWRVIIIFSRSDTRTCRRPSLRSQVHGYLSCSVRSIKRLYLISHAGLHKIKIRQLSFPAQYSKTVKFYYRKIIMPYGIPNSKFNYFDTPPPIYGMTGYHNK